MNEITEAFLESFENRNEEHDDQVPFTDTNSIRGLGTVNVPRPPEDYVPPPLKVNSGQPPFEDVDNPGDWHQFCYLPRFNKKGEYISHSLPTKVEPCPLTDGVRRSNGWVFLYKDWELKDCWTTSHFPDLADGNIEVPVFRNGAVSHTSLFPTERKGHLDYAKLSSMGLTKERLLLHDPLFFYQLILPFCDPSKSGIENDPRMPYYSNVSNVMDTEICL
jgi:hypothetical protein